MLAMIGIFAVVSSYQSKNLSNVVDKTNTKQQAAIKDTSGKTMDQVINMSMTKTNALQAYVADDMFSEVKSDVEMLQLFATELFENQDKLELQPVNYPKRDMKGIASAQMQHGEGVDPNDSDKLRVISNMQEMMISMYRSSDKLSSCIVATSDGVTLYVDYRSDEYFDGNGYVIKFFEARERPWYKGAAEAGGIYFTGIERESFTNYIGIVCAAPVYYNGELVAVVAADVFLDTMADYVNESAESGGYICVVNGEGQVIFAPENNDVFTVQTSDKADDLRNSDNKELAEFITTALQGQTGLKVININSKDYYMQEQRGGNVRYSMVRCSRNIDRQGNCRKCRTRIPHSQKSKWRV